MKCNAPECATSSARHLWKCHGTCGRSYHAACIGAKRDWEDELRNFVLPLCAQCAPDLTEKYSLQQIIIKQTENQHRVITQLQNVTNMQEAVEQIEKRMAAVEKHMIAGKQQLASTLTEILEHSLSANVADQLSTVVRDTNNEFSKILSMKMAESFHRVEQTISQNQNVQSMEAIAVAKAAAKSAAAVAVATMAEKTSTQSTDLDSLPQFITAVKNNITDAHTTLACEIKSQLEETLKTLTTTVHHNMTQNSAEITPSIMEHHRSIAEELELSSCCPRTSIEIPNKSGWRFIGSKKVWKQNWTDYDNRQRTRRHQEKEAEKANRKRKQRRRRFISNSNNANGSKNTNAQLPYTELPVNKERNSNTINNTNNINSINSHNKSNSSKTLLPLDKDLIAAAKIQFSAPTHPVNNYTAKFINFQKGETINPYRTAKPPSEEVSPTITESIDLTTTPHDSQFELDPLRPPIMRLTEQSTSGDGRYLKARLRDPKIMKIVRLYLAFMKDQQSSVCVEGMTATSIRMLLSSEGLPTTPEHLQRIFMEVHQEYGLTPAEAASDLTAYRHFLTSERTHRLQQLRESTTKFGKPTPTSNFRK